MQDGLDLVCEASFLSSKLDMRICRGVYGTALPESIPAIKKKHVDEFNKRWKNFRLSDPKRSLYEGARELYRNNSF